MKTKVIFIYGAPAVGKLTTATLLAGRNGCKLLHNHLTTDLVRAIFDSGNPKGVMYAAKLRLELLEIAVQEKVKGLIMTGVHAHNFIYPNGENDEWFAKRLESVTEENGGEFYGINLIANRESLFHRVTEKSRVQWRKINTQNVLEEVLAKYDFMKTAPLKNNLVLDNTNLSAEEVVEKIESFASLRG